MSTHEQRLAQLQAEIRALETENVAPKDWSLLGETSARTRPHDALLAHDLEFDRTARHVPVITDASVAALEARIKARIQEGRFDDVVRTRVVDVPFLPSRVVEMQDTKSALSLAQIYEGEYVKAQGGLTDDRDGRLQREHDEITRVWEGICAKLDALCNAHYAPKQPKATITTVSDLPAASLESALPSSRSFASMLAPEEVLAPTSATDVRARSELTPAEKRARRTKERKARKKMHDALSKVANRHTNARKKGSAKQEKETALKSLVKSGKGVTVVGKQSTMLKKTGARTKKLK